MGSRAGRCRPENKQSLSEAATEKVQKYKAVASKLKSDLGVPDAEVVLIVVGSRETLPKLTTDLLGQINIARKYWLTISLIALRSSIEIANAFMNE